MNDLGIALAWVAVQVTLVLIPALTLAALASRRGPASGAWVSTLSLGLVAALSVASLFGASWTSVEPEVEANAFPPPSQSAAPSHLVAAGESLHSDASSPKLDGGWELSRLRSVWDRLGRAAAEPAALARPLGSILAVFALVAMGYSLLRLLTGLLAVEVCRRRGSPIDDPEITGLFDQLRGEMGCPKSVEMREAAELTTPATAGWLRPILLLPDDWRTWNLDERRAVLAHELAHVVRGDYAAGLFARIAVILNTYHPLVRWTAGRLELQQEQAADALAARFAGGRSSYLVVLARLALKQDGRSPRWPARAFLPERGTLIRRIAMLRDQSESRNIDRPTSSASRLLATFTLVGLTVGVAMLRGPARADGDDVPADTAKSPAPVENEPIFPPYIRNGSAGVVVFRPSAASRILGEDVISLILSEAFDDLAILAQRLQVDMSRPNFIKLGFKDIEWIASGIRFGRGRTSTRNDLHSFMAVGFAMRTTVSFDWLSFLRQWSFECTEVREGQRSYYQLKGPMAPTMGPNPCVYLVDDRTIVFDDEKPIRALATGEMPPLATYLQSEEWRRASRGLLAVAIGNEKGSFAKQYDLGRPDDATALSLFKGVSFWVLGVDDSAALSLHAQALCQDANARVRIAKKVEALLKLGRAACEQGDVADGSPEVKAIINRMTKALLANVRIEHTDRTIRLDSEGFGTLADVGSIIRAETKAAQSGPPVAADASRKAKR